MATAPPILIWSPVGGTPGGEGPTTSEPEIGDIITNAGTTQLVEGQSYIDVVFDHVQVDDEWIFVECSVVNTTDVDTLNIWPGIITSKLTTGFRLQLNGMPDSDNYFLNWAVSGVNIEPTPATTYILSGPSSGGVGVPSTFTVHLPSSTTVSGAVIITPELLEPEVTDSRVTTSGDIRVTSNGDIRATLGGGGTFAPSSVTLTTGAPSATFTYTPATEGTKTISVTNDGGLVNPADITFIVSAVATGYSLSGPSTGAVGVASTDFTVTLTPSGGAVTGTVTVTPSSGGGGGTFTPTTVALTTAAPSVTFTYTPGSTGAKTISVTNNGGLTDPGSLTYTVSVGSLSDGDPVSIWLDSSVNGNNATQTGSSRPKYKTAIVNGKPVVRFYTILTSGLNLTTPIDSASPWTVFAVMKQTGGATAVLHTLACSTAANPMAFVLNLDGNLYTFDQSNIKFAPNIYSAAFHVYTGNMAGGGTGAIYVDGTSIATSPATYSSTADFDNLGWRGFTPEYSDGDIAELIFYSATLSGTDRENIEKYLGDKYGITVAGGSAVQPDTVTGIKGWWKADSL